MKSKKKDIAKEMFEYFGIKVVDVKGEIVKTKKSLRKKLI